VTVTGGNCKYGLEYVVGAWRRKTALVMTALFARDS
jgi:hypothetical protein